MKKRFSSHHLSLCFHLLKHGRFSHQAAAADGYFKKNDFEGQLRQCLSTVLFLPLPPLKHRLSLRSFRVESELAGGAGAGPGEQCAG